MLRRMDIFSLFLLLAVTVVGGAVQTPTLPLWTIEETYPFVSRVVTTHDWAAFGMRNFANTDPTLTSFNPRTGSLQWVRNFSQSNNDDFQGAPQAFLCTAYPAVVFAVVAGSYAGAYVALNRTTGELLWTLPVYVRRTEDATWLCPGQIGDALVVTTFSVLYAVDVDTGKFLYERYIDVTVPIKTWRVDRCGSADALRCAAFEDQDGTHLFDLASGVDVTNSSSFPSLQQANLVATAGHLLVFGGYNYTSALLWNGTVAWTARATYYLGGDDKVWVSSTTVPRSTVSAYSIRTGELLWTWADPCTMMHSPGNSCVSGMKVSFDLELPIAYTSCATGAGCSAVAFDPNTGVVKWFVVDATLAVTTYDSVSSEPFLGSTEFTYYTNATDTTIIRVATGETRHVPSSSGAIAVAASATTITVQTGSNIRGYAMFG